MRSKIATLWSIIMGTRKYRTIVLAAFCVVAAAGLAIAGWKRWERTQEEERDHSLRVCAARDCKTPSDCAIGCARRFLARNGWFDPALAKPDEAVFEFRDQPASQSIKDLLRLRARIYRPNPTMVCTEPFGFRVLFPYPTNENPLWGGVVIMTRDYKNLRVAKTQEIFHTLPPDCAFTQWATP